MLLSEILYIEEMITKYRDVSGNYLNYIPLLRPFSTAAELLGFSKGEKLMADVGKRRYGYHAALQQNLRREIELGVDKPWYVPESHFPFSYNHLLTTLQHPRQCPQRSRK